MQYMYLSVVRQAHAPGVGANPTRRQHDSMPSMPTPPGAFFVCLFLCFFLFFILNVHCFFVFYSEARET
jgi:hypothetical protein